MVNLKIDMHLHTVYSKDALITPKDLIELAITQHLDGIAICDHYSLKAYKMLKKEAKRKDFILIPGMEIETHIGEVLALFIEKEINTENNNFFNIIHQIKDQNGLVVVPHPFDFLRSNHLKLNLLNESTIEKYLDGIEIINSRIVFNSCIKKAKKFNEIYNLFETGGSDAHTNKEIGNGYTLLKNVEERTLEGVKRSLLLKDSQSQGQRSCPLVHFITVMNKFRKGLYF